jgi:hypothetical protein
VSLRWPDAAFRDGVALAGEPPRSPDGGARIQSAPIASEPQRPPSHVFGRSPYGSGTKSGLGSLRGSGAWEVSTIVPVKLEVGAGLPTKQAQSVLTEQDLGARQCHDGLGSQEGPRGFGAVARLLISSTGTVARAQIETQPPRPALVVCLEKWARGLAFAVPSAGKTVEVEYRFRLELR